MFSEVGVLVLLQLFEQRVRIDAYSLLSFLFLCIILSTQGVLPTLG